MALYKTLVKKVSISPEKKTKQKDYLPKGQLPIIDQGQQLIGGYSDNPDLQLSCNLPVIVFGDHTRAVKYVDFPFGAGADGIKVLDHFNIARECGSERAVIKKFTVNVTDGTGLKVGFTPVKGKPVLNAVRIYKCF